MDRKVDDYRTRGYKIESRGEYSTKVKEKDWGELPVHGFLFLAVLIIGAIVVDLVSVTSGAAWVLAFLASASYAGYSWFTAEELLIKIDQAD
jgi:hypothetical protein